MVIVIVLTTAYLIYTGYTYYNTALEERFYHPHHNWFKPSGAYGHGLGIVGTLMIFFGVFWGAVEIPSVDLLGRELQFKEERGYEENGQVSNLVFGVHACRRNPDGADHEGRHSGTGGRRQRRPAASSRRERSDRFQHR